jgi:hypothetical protein
VQWDTLALAQQNYPTGEDPLTVFCTTLVAANMSAGRDTTFASFRYWRARPYGPRTLAHLKAFGQHKLRVPAQLTNIESAPPEQDDGLFSSRIEVITSHRLARTESGYLVLVPELAQAGDLIGLFRGGRLPFILRLRRPVGAHWRCMCSWHHVWRGSG